MSEKELEEIIQQNSFPSYQTVLENMKNTWNPYPRINMLNYDLITHNILVQIYNELPQKKICIKTLTKHVEIFQAYHTINRICKGFLSQNQSQIITFYLKTLFLL